MSQQGCGKLIATRVFRLVIKKEKRKRKEKKTKGKASGMTRSVQELAVLFARNVCFFWGKKVVVRKGKISLFVLGKRIVVRKGKNLVFLFGK
jgi:hypothetical protein